MVLKKRSYMFPGLYQPNCTKVIIKGYTEEAMEALLHFVYLNEIIFFDDDNLEQLLDMAERYGVPSLLPRIKPLFGNEYLQSDESSDDPSVTDINDFDAFVSGTYHTGRGWCVTLIINIADYLMFDS